MPRTRTRVDARLRKLESLAEDIAERQKLSRLDTVVFLLFPVLLLITTSISNVITNYQSIVKIPVIGPFIAQNLSSLLIAPFGVLLFTFLLFLKAYLGDDLKGRIDSCSLIYGYTWYFLLFFIQTQIPALIYGWAQGQGWLIAFLPSLFSAILILAAFYFVSSTQVSLSGRIAAWLQENVPRKWKQDGLSTERVPSYRKAYLRHGKLAWAVACALYAIMFALAVARGGLKAVSAFQFGLFLALALVMFGALQGERICQVLRKALRRTEMMLAEKESKPTPKSF
jgi:hypothetical protein